MNAALMLTALLSMSITFVEHGGGMVKTIQHVRKVHSLLAD